MTTPEGTGSLDDGFTVTPPALAVESLNPNSGSQGQHWILILPVPTWREPRGLALEKALLSTALIGTVLTHT